jgi:uncharacterized protein (DUF2147 family)
MTSGFKQAKIVAARTCFSNCNYYLRPFNIFISILPMKKFSFLLMFFVFGISLAWAQEEKDTPLGTWINEEKEARFEIYKCGNRLCGKITWLKEPLRNGKPKMDDQNPEAKLRTRPILGMVFMKDFEYDSGLKWDEGSIYDPKSGKTYSCYMKIISNDKMEVKGYIGISLIGRTQTWTRVK